MTFGPLDFLVSFWGVFGRKVGNWLLSSLRELEAHTQSELLKEIGTKKAKGQKEINNY